MKKFIFLFLIFSSALAEAQNEKLSRFTANISGLTGGTITLQQLLDAKEISVSESCWMVTSYRFTAFIKDKEPIERDFNFDQIPIDLKEIISTLPSGTKIYFEYIKATDVRGTKPALPALSFVLQ